MSDFGKAFMTGLGGSLAGLPGAVVGAGLNVAGSLYAQKRSEENQRKINEQNRQWQLEDRKHDELYNSPAMQKARMMDAGIGGDYSNLVSPVATSSQTAVASAPQNEMSAFGSLGNTASASFASMAQMGMDYAMNTADYDLKLEQAKKIVLEAERQRIENEWLPTLNKLSQDLGNADLVQKKLDIKSSEIANFVADGLKEITVEMGKVSLETANIELEGKNLQNKGFQLDNKLKTVIIAGKEFELNEIMPLEVKELEGTIQLLSDDHSKNIEIIKGLGIANQSALFALFGQRLEYLTDKVTYDAIQKNYGKYCESIEKKLRGGIRNSNYENNIFNTGGFRDFNNYVTDLGKSSQNTAGGVLRTMLGAAVMRGMFSSEIDGWSGWGASNSYSPNNGYNSKPYRHSHHKHYTWNGNSVSYE